MKDFSDLIRKEDALALLCRSWTPARGRETVPLEAAAGRVLAEDQFARCDQPVVRASAMDGVAVQAARFAGSVPDASGWRYGTDYVRADTGDDFDDAFDAVVPIENVALLPDGGLRFHGELSVQPGTNVRPEGSNVKRGSLLVRAGTVLDALALSAVAMGGISAVPVVKRPRVAFLPTGSELIEPGQPLQRGQNYDSNSVLVRRMLLDMGAEPVMHPVVPDDPARLKSAVCDLLSRADILLVNAGTSKGGEDYCRAILQALWTPLFDGIAAVPGRPINAGIADGKPVINLSGPSFAAFYSMDYMVRGLVCHALGIPVPERERVTAKLTAPLRTPPMFSMMVPMELKREAGGLTAAPVALRGPGDEITVELLHAAGSIPTA